MTTPTRVPGKYGRKPRDMSRRTLKLTRAHVDALKAARTKIPTPRPSVDDISQVASYPMYDNDRYGDCVWAMIGHAIQIQSLLGLRSEVDVTVDALLKGYTDVTGFDPADPSTDQGTNVQDALNYWRTTGIARPDGTVDQILAFAEVDHTDRALVADCVGLFGPGMKGVNLPQSAEDQFGAGQPWTVVAGSPIVGGHAVLTAAYTMPSPSELDTDEVTWGQAQKVTDAWNAEYVEEQYFVITRDWFSANGVDPNGEAATVLGEEFAAVTGEPNPFPAPQPTPGPVVPPAPPAPQPVPVSDVHVDAADEELMAALVDWDKEPHIGGNARARDAYDRWQARKAAAKQGSAA